MIFLKKTRKKMATIAPSALKSAPAARRAAARSLRGTFADRDRERKKHPRLTTTEQHNQTVEKEGNAES